MRRKRRRRKRRRRKKKSSFECGGWGRVIGALPTGCTHPSIIDGAVHLPAVAGHANDVRTSRRHLILLWSANNSPLGFSSFNLFHFSTLQGRKREKEKKRKREKERHSNPSAAARFSLGKHFFQFKFIIRWRCFWILSPSHCLFKWTPTAIIETLQGKLRINRAGLSSTRKSGQYRG